MSRGIFIFLLLVLCFSACNKSDLLPSNTYNQLQNDGAILPVHIHGNRNSEVAIIVVHGGPGESAILKRDAVGLYRLEEDQLVVYYDQRESGITEGNIDPQSITIEQMAKDLKAVVELVDKITNAKSIFILSLDWGAAIATAYLSGPDINSNVKGFIATNPGFNAPKYMEASLDTLQSVVDQIELLAPGISEEFELFLDQNSTINKFNYQTYNRLINGLYEIVFKTEYLTAGIDLPAFIKRQVDNNEQFVQENLSFEGAHFLENMNVEDLLPIIPVPTKIIWGIHDLLFPVHLAKGYNDLLGNASDAEQISYFQNSAHRPYYEEGDAFYAVVATWITFFD